MGNLCQGESHEKRANRAGKYAASNAEKVDTASSSCAPQFADGHFERGRIFSGEDDVTALAGVTGSLLIAGDENGNVRVFDPHSGAVKLDLPRYHTSDVNKLVSSTDGHLVASASRDKRVKLLGFGDNIESPTKATFEGHTLNVTCVAIDPASGKRLFSGSRDNTVRLWDVETEKAIACCDTKLNIVHSCSWIPNLNAVAQGGEDLKIRLWDVRTDGRDMSLRSCIENFDYHPICMAVVPDGTGTTIVTGHNGFNNTGAYVSLWDLRMMRCEVEMRGHQNTVRWVTPLSRATRDGMSIGDQLLSASDDGTIREWSTAKRDSVATYRVPEGRVTAAVEVLDENKYPTFAVSCRGGNVFTCSLDPKANALRRVANFGTLEGV